MQNIDVLWCPPLLSAAVSALFIVQIPSEKTILDNKGSKLPSARWRQHIGLFLTAKCGARATEQCNWRGSWSRSGSRLGAGRALLTDKRHGTCDLGFFFSRSFFICFLSPTQQSSRCCFRLFVSHVCRISPPSQNPHLILVKPHGAYFPAVDSNELFLHSYNPFKHTTGRR